MKYVSLALIILLLLVPTSAQDSSDFKIITSNTYSITPNDIGEAQYSRVIPVLDLKTDISPDKDEVLIQLNITNIPKATGVELTLIKEQVNNNASHPHQSSIQIHSVRIAPQKGSLNLTMLVHWHNLLPSSACQSCDFTNHSRIETRFFTDDNVWDSEARISSTIKHRNRAVTLHDFEAILIETPGVNVGEVDVNPSKGTEETVTNSTSITSDSVNSTTTPFQNNSSENNYLDFTEELPIHMPLAGTLLVLILWKNPKRRDRKIVE